MRFKNSDTKRKIAIGALFLIIFMLLAAVFFLHTSEPDNPIDETLQVSRMWNTGTRLLADQEKINRIDSANINDGKADEKSPSAEEQKKDDGETENDSRQGSSDANNVSSPDISQIVDIDENSQSSGEQHGNNNGQSDQGNDTSDDGDSVDAYFSTSIINGDILDKKEYSFVIKHLKPELTVKGISVTVNGEENTYSPKTGRFETNLALGENKIIVKVMYQSEGNTITASKGYTVYYAPGDKVVIVTDLFDRTVDQSSISFSAYGLKGSKKLDATVKVNGRKINGNGENYEAPLELGDNTITITAGGRTDSVTKTYRVTYAENIFKIVTTLSSTVLYGTEVQTSPEAVVYTGKDENCKFKVHVNKVTGKEKLVSVRAFFYDNSNGKVLKADADGYYTMTIPTRGSALVTLTYLDSSGSEHRYQYSVRFKRTSGTTPVEKQPRIEARVEVGNQILNLQSGMEFKSPNIVININAKSYQNEQLYYNHMTVVVNGQKYPQHSYQVGSWFGYDVYLKQGENIITISLMDDDQYTVTKTYKLYYTPGKVKITVSVEATTVGLGYLIPRQTVEVDGGTSVAEIVTDLLTKYGYTYDSTGSINNGFYLARIKRPGITNGYSIPSDLKAMIEADGGDISMETGPVSPDSLGEFDFYRYSGWMYSYNGSYPGYSMSSCKPQDGAVIRVRFTLALGKDIGGSVSSGGSYGGGSIQGNYGKEW